MIKHGICTSFKEELLEGLHRAGHTYKLALYTADANIGPDTKFYTAQGESSGKGYESGGGALQGYRHGRTGNSAWLTWDHMIWPTVSVQARGALIYNASLPEHNAVCVIDFLENKAASEGPFRVKIPQPEEGEGLVVIP